MFDVSQTSGVELPEMHEISGDPGENIDRLAAFLKQQGTQLHLQHERFAKLWDKNLREQGFAEAFERRRQHHA